jgi:hypothetical protein
MNILNVFQQLKQRRNEMTILHPSRIGEFNPYNRDYPIHYVVDCLIWHLWVRKQNWVVYWATAPALKAYNTPAKWYTYTIGAWNAYKFCRTTLAMAVGKRIKQKTTAPLFKKEELSLEERRILIAESIQEFLTEGHSKRTLREFLESDYKPWADAILEVIG